MRRCWRHARLLERHRPAASNSSEPTAQERQPLEKVECGLGAPQRDISACKRLGRSIWKKLSGYHSHSLAATTMHCFMRVCEHVPGTQYCQ